MSRVILGTAAVTDEAFLDRCLEIYGEKNRRRRRHKGRLCRNTRLNELSGYTCDSFLRKCRKKGISNIICTDISRDGMLGGTNIELYRALSEKIQY